MPPDTLKTLQDLEITGGGAAWAQQQQQQQQDDNHTQHYEQQQQQQPIEGHGQQPAQPLRHLDLAAAPHPAPLPAHPPEQPHPTVPFYPPPLLNHHFALDADSTLPIDPGLLDARFDHPAASGHAGGGVPGFHHGHGHGHHGHHGGQQHFAAAHMQPVSSASMDNTFMVSPTAFTTQYTNSPAQLQPGMSSFEPMISTTWSMDGSLPSTSSRGLTVSSGMSVPSTSTPASSRSPGSPGRVGPGVGSQPPPASRDLSYSGMQLGAWAGDQPGKKRRQTVGPRATARASTTETSRSHRINSSPGFSTPQVPIAPAPISTAAAGGNNSKSIDNRKGSSSSSSGNSKHAGKTTMTTTTAPTTITTTTTSNTGGPSIQAQPGPSTTITTNPGLPLVPDPRARNREAANRCRAKSKVAAAELEATERALGCEHEALTLTARSLRDEVLALKTELLMHGNCDDELIQRYLINSARVVGSGAAGTLGGAPGITAAAMTTATTGTGGGGTLPGLPLQQQPLPPGPPLGGGGVGSSSHAMPPVSPPRGLPTLLPSPSSGVPGAGQPLPTTATTTTTTTATGRTARGRGSIGGQRP